MGLSMISFMAAIVLAGVIIAAVTLLLQSGVRRFLFQAPPENTVSDLLPFLYVDTEGHTLVLKDGTLVQVIALEGVDFSTVSEGDDQRYFALRKNLFNELAQNPAFSAEVRMISLKIPAQHGAEDLSAYPSKILKTIHTLSIPADDEVFHVQHVLVVSVSPRHAKQEAILHDTVTYIMDTLHDYRPTRLAHGAEDSPLLTMWRQVLLEFNHELRPKLRDLSAHLSPGVIEFDPSTGLIRQRDGETEWFGYIFSVKGWGDYISGEFLREVFTLKAPVQLLQLLEPKTAQSAELILENQKRLSTVRFNRVILDEFTQAIEEVQSQEESLFYVSTHVYIFQTDLNKLNAIVSAFKQIAATYGVRAAVETRAVEYLWFARFPSYAVQTRPLKMLTSQLVGSQEFHKSPSGLQTCDWGDGPLRTFKTASGAKYGLQLHITARREELAHALVIAPSNSGKTTLFQHLIGGALRFPNLRAFMFDRLRGTQIFTESMGGTYVDLAKFDVQLNPFALDMTLLANRRFLHRFLLQLSGVEDDMAHGEADQLLNLLDKTALKDRTLATGYNFGARTSGSAFSKGLRKWAMDDTYRHIFQGPQDTLNLMASRLIGFEMTEIQQDPVVAGAVMNYLLYRIRQLCSEGSPHMVFIDETAPMLRDPQFKNQVAEMLREHRKLRGSITVCFQNPGDMEATGLRETILNQCQTVFLFQNPQAKAADYAMFDLTESQWEFIKGISSVGRKVKRGVLVKKPNESVIIDVDLSNLGPYLKLYRSGNDAVALVNELKATYGDGQWIDAYLGDA